MTRVRVPRDEREEEVPSLLGPESDERLVAGGAYAQRVGVHACEDAKVAEEAAAAQHQ